MGLWGRKRTSLVDAMCRSISIRLPSAGVRLVASWAETIDYHPRSCGAWLYATVLGWDKIMAKYRGKLTSIEVYDTSCRALVKSDILAGSVHTHLVPLLSSTAGSFLT